MAVRPRFTDENVDKLNEDLTKELESMEIPDAEKEVVPNDPLPPEPNPAVVAANNVPVQKATTSMVKAEDCSFEAVANKFYDFLESISLGGIILDAYIEVKEDFLFCGFAEPTCQFISGFNQFPDVKVNKSGKMVITDISKIKDTVKLFGSNTITVSYASGKILVKGEKKKLSVTTLDESYINSLKGIMNREINLETGIIGKLNFKDFTCFKISTSDIAEVLSAGKSLRLEKNKFSIKTGATDIDVTITNNQDTANLVLTPKDLIVKEDLDVAFHSRGLSKLAAIFSGDINIWVNKHILVANSGTSYYMLISELK